MQQRSFRTRGLVSLASLSALAFDQAGNLWVAGTTSGALDGDFGGDLFDVFVRKYSPSGEILWRTQYGLDCHARSLAVDPNGNVLVLSAITLAPDQTDLVLGGGGGSDSSLRKYSPSGDLLWERMLGATGDDSYQMTLAGDRPIVYGSFEGKLFGTQSKGSTDMAVIALDASGEVLWNAVHATGGQDAVWDLAAAPDGSLVGIGAESFDCCSGVGRSIQWTLTPEGQTAEYSTLFPSREFANQVEVDAQGSAFYHSFHFDTDGNRVSKGKPGGNELWRQTYPSDGTSLLRLTQDNHPVLLNSESGLEFMEWTTEGVSVPTRPVNSGGVVLEAFVVAPDGKVAVGGAIAGALSGHSYAGNHFDGFILVFDHIPRPLEATE